MRALVTGGGGFIGSHLVEGLLRREWEVVALGHLDRFENLGREVRSRIEAINGDVTDEPLVRQAARGCDTIFHFAGVLPMDHDASSLVRTEIVGLRNVAFAALANHGARLVYASTSGVYGPNQHGRPVSEDEEVIPCSPYALSKRYNEICLQSLFAEHGLESLSIRCFNVYGPRQTRNMVVPKFIVQALENEDITIYGAGLQARDFVYVSDMAEATLDLGEVFTGCTVVNASFGHEITIRDLALKIKEMSGSDSPVLFKDVPNSRTGLEVDRLVGDNSRLCALAGFRKTVTLDQGLGKTIAYYRMRKRALQHA